MHSEIILDIDLEGHDSPELVVQRRKIISGMVDQVLQGKYNFLSIDGVPGIGKTYLMDRIMEEVARRGVAVAAATMDMDVLPRTERGDKEITKYHPGNIAREAISRHQGARSTSFDFMSHGRPQSIAASLLHHNNGSSSFDFKEYDGKTGQHSKEARLTVPGKANGLLIVEGFTAAAFVESLIDSTIDRLYEVYLTGPMELAEQQRLGRDVNEKGLAHDEIMRRLETQRSSLKSFDADTWKRMTTSTHAVRRSPIHL
ncbi:MAG: hypothetical protein NTZ25_03060 [Candidatus Peregrinibacteria bacterium]|nr:hypothetical protein [Candidatus Peregrinibacteria bacterium]